MGMVDVPKVILDFSDLVNCEPDVHVGLDRCIEAADVSWFTELVLDFSFLWIVVLWHISTGWR